MVEGARVNNPSDSNNNNKDNNKKVKISKPDKFYKE